MQSTLFVPISGRIKDLNVRINSIDHSFVGDLKVELVSPDNSTTVRLIEHVGGPNNGGDDLVDTVFDDEAATTIGSGASAAPYTGSFRPQGDQLERFDGKEQQGTWKLRVSDRYENDTGSLLGWGLTIRTAQCDPDVNAPDTEIQAAPPSLAGSRTASFEFTASKAGTQFQCRLDGGDFSPCTSPQQFGNLPEGTHTFEVRAFDSKGNVDGSPAMYTWTIDVTAPAPRITAASGSAPSVQGTGGTASGDDGSVTVDLFSGSAASGSPVQTVVASRDGSGSFSAQFDRVAGGTYTATARQSDAAGNTGSSSPVSFTAPGDAAAGAAARLRRLLDRGVARRRLRRQAHSALGLRGRLPPNHLARRLVQDGRAPRPAAPRQPRRPARQRRHARQAHPRSAHRTAPQGRRHGHAPGDRRRRRAVEGDQPSARRSSRRGSPAAASSSRVSAPPPARCPRG